MPVSNLKESEPPNRGTLGLQWQETSSSLILRIMLDLARATPLREQARQWCRFRDIYQARVSIKVNLIACKGEAGVWGEESKVGLEGKTENMHHAVKKWEDVSTNQPCHILQNCISKPYSF